MSTVGAERTLARTSRAQHERGPVAALAPLPDRSLGARRSLPHHTPQRVAAQGYHGPVAKRHPHAITGTRRASPYGRRGRYRDRGA